MMPAAAGITVQVTPPLRMRAFAPLRLRGEDGSSGCPDARARWPFPASDTTEEEREELQQRLCRRRQRVDQRVQERIRLDDPVAEGCCPPSTSHAVPAVGAWTAAMLVALLSR